MQPATSLPRSVADAVESFVMSRRREAVVSLGDAVRAVRFLFPDCEHTDRELAELVAISAVRNGRDVAFDVMRPANDILTVAADARIRA